MSEFKVGDKIVCIETDTRALAANNITYGEEYIVQGRDAQGVDIISDIDIVEYVYDIRFRLAEEKEMEQTAEQIRNEILRIDVRIEEAKKDIENAESERNSLVEKLREKGFELGGTSNQYIKLGDRVEITGWSKERHEKSHIGRKGIIEKIDNTDIPFKVILDDENEDSNTWFEANQVKKI